MFSRKVKLVCVLLAITFIVSLAGCGQKAATEEKKGWAPQKPITLVAVVGAGGGIDALARTITKVLDQKKMVNGQALMVENKPGGGQVTGTVAFATQYGKDEHKIMVASLPFTLNYIKKDGKSPIGPDQIYPLAMVQADYAVIAVKTDSKYNTIKELMDAIKADPTKITIIGGGAPGATDHLNVAKVAQKAGVNIKTMKFNSYEGGGEALTALLGGHGEALSTDASSIKQYLQAGKVRVLGIASKERMTDEVMKVIPTYKEQGYDVEHYNWRGVFLGKDVPEPAKKYWGEKMAELVKTQEWKDEMKKQGLIEMYLEPKAFYDYLKAEQKAYLEIYKELGMADTEKK